MSQFTVLNPDGSVCSASDETENDSNMPSLESGAGMAWVGGKEAVLCGRESGQRQIKVGCM